MITKRYFLTLYYGDYTVADKQIITEKQAKEYLKNFETIAEKTKFDHDCYEGTNYTIKTEETEQAISTTYHIQGVFWFEILLEKVECKAGYHFNKIN